MKVRVTFEFDETDRRALAYRFGKDRPASHADLANHIQGIVAEMWTDYRHEYITGQSWDEDDAEAAAPGNFV